MLARRRQRAAAGEFIPSCSLYVPVVPWGIMHPDTSTVLLFTAADCAAVGLSLDLRCACSFSRVIPFRMMVRDNPCLAKASLERILPRLRCSKRCRQPPSRAVLLNAVEHASHAGSARTSPLSWHQVLIGDS